MLGLTLKEPISQNGQTHSNNSLENRLSVFDHFVELALQESKKFLTQDSVLKRYARLSFYYCYLVEEMA